MPQNDPITLQEISQIIIEISSKQKKNFAEENEENKVNTAETKVI